MAKILSSTSALSMIDDYIIITNLLVNGYPYSKGTIVKALAVADGKALVLDGECRQFRVDTCHLMKVPDVPITPLKRKPKTKLRKRNRKWK